MLSARALHRFPPGARRGRISCRCQNEALHLIYAIVDLATLQILGFSNELQSKRSCHHLSIGWGVYPNTGKFTPSTNAGFLGSPANEQFFGRFSARLFRRGEERELV